MKVKVCPYLPWQEPSTTTDTGAKNGKVLVQNNHQLGKELGRQDKDGRRVKKRPVTPVDNVQPCQKRFIGGKKTSALGLNSDEENEREGKNEDVKAVSGPSPKRRRPYNSARPYGKRLSALGLTSSEDEDDDDSGSGNKDKDKSSGGKGKKEESLVLRGCKSTTSSPQKNETSPNRSFTSEDFDELLRRSIDHLTSDYNN